MGWLAMLSCAPLLFCQVRPPLPVVAALWAVAGAGGAYQLAAAAAFVRALPRGQQVRAFAVAQSGLLAAQVLGIVAAGAVAQRVGPQAAVALAGLLGLIAAAVLATDWIHRHGEVLDRLTAPHDRLIAPHDQPADPHHQPADPHHQPADPHHQLTDPHHQPAGGQRELDAPRRQTAHGGQASRPADANAKRPAGASDTLPDGSLRVPAPLLGRRHAHRAPRDLPGEARLAAARLLDQILGDRRALPLFRDDDPPGQVDQRAHAKRDHRDSQEDEPDQGGVDAEVLGDPGADTGHQPAVPRPD